VGAGFPTGDRLQPKGDDDKETIMRKSIVTACAAAAMFSTILIASNRADAMATSSPAGLLAATETAGQAEQVAYVCGWNGYRRVCWWRPGGYYGFYRPYRWHRWRRW
jgi:hypothetical protein